ncbi:MAG TPA: hypothetical protein PKK69_05590, partial [Ferruginibacter sp.]|nr:hypothetical protein [Ferruginibacter sp.]
AVADALWSELKKNGAKDWSEDDFIKYCYYRLRNLVMNRDTYLSDKTAAYLLATLLDNRDIKSEIIISVSNKIGQMKDVLFDDEIRYVIRVKDKLYYNITDHSNPGDLSESLVGCESYIISEPDKKGNQEIKPFTLPNTVSNDNASVYDFTVSIDKEMTNLVVSRTTRFTGISKTRNIEEALRYTTYMLDDYKNYNGNPPTEKMNERQEEEYLKTVKALKDNFKEMKPEYVKNQLEKEFGRKVNSKGFTIASGGRTLKNQDLTFTEEFEIGGFIRKAGKKYLVNLIGLVGGQLQIKKDERNRKHDISMGYPRMIAWNIKMKIPEGYTAEGMSDMAMNVDNSSGSYSCAAEQVGNEIVLTIKKVYKQNFLPKDKWTEVLAFVDAAYNHLHKYILLKPKA